MPLHIGEVRSEVIVEPEPQPAGEGPPEKPSWELIDRHRWLRSHVKGREQRTRAEGLDD